MIEPAAVNGHTHLYSGLAPLGIPLPSPLPQSFLQILEQVWWRLDRALDAESLEASARFYAADALLSGTSLLVDHHESPNLIEGSLDILADACAGVGIRALLCYGATERNGGRREGRRGLEECRRFLTTNRRRGIKGAIGLHASFTVSDETIAEAMDMARDLGAIVHVHVAEDRADVEDAQQRGFAGPLERLMSFGGMPAGSILAHGVHLSQSQVRMANNAGLWLVQNPRSNHGNHVGYPHMLRFANKVAVGTDGYPAHMAEEEAALYAEAAAQGDVTQDLPRRCRGGLQLANELFGDHADLANWKGDHLEILTVCGRDVVRRGVLVNANLAEIRAHAQEQAGRVWARME